MTDTRDKLAAALSEHDPEPYDWDNAYYLAYADALLASDVLLDRLEAAEAANKILRGRLARVEALADAWSAVPPYTPSSYDVGRVEQRQMCETELRAALDGEATDG